MTPCACGLSQIGWQQVNAGLDEVEAVPFSCIDLSVASGRKETALEATAAELHKLEPGGGSTVAGGSVGSGRQPAEPTAISYSSLAVDGVSWQLEGSPASLQLSQGEQSSCL